MSDLSARPLVSSRQSDLYVERPEADIPLRRALESQLNALVVGARGSGKTSTVMQAALRSGQALSVVNAQLAQTPLDLINLIADGIATGLPVTARAAQLARLAAPTRSLAGKVAVLRVDNPVTVLIDNLEDADIASAIFGGLRDELWTTNLSFVVVAQPEAAQVLMSPPADAFFDVRVVLGALSEPQQIDLLKRRNTSLVAKLTKPGGALARDVVAAARVVELDSDGTLQASQRVEALTASQQRVLDSLRRFGRPVTVRDDELLQDTELSRHQLARILAQLENEGLVSSFRRKDGQTGRPPTMYVVSDQVRAG